MLLEEYEAHFNNKEPKHGYFYLNREARYLANLLGKDIIDLTLKKRLFEVKKDFEKL